MSAETPQVATLPATASSSSLNSRDGEEWPQPGEIVWVQTHETLPAWPAKVIDGSQVPTDMQMFGKVRKGKRAIYMYGSANYDVAKTKQMRPYSEHREEYGDKQSISDTMMVLFEKAVALADKEILLSPQERLQNLSNKPEGTYLGTTLPVSWLFGRLNVIITLRATAVARASQYLRRTDIHVRGGSA